jgi:hypothetical protein
MRSFIALTMLLIGSVAFATAGGNTTVPEIDSATGIAALALFSGALLVIRGRRKN